MKTGIAIVAIVIGIAAGIVFGNIGAGLIIKAPVIATPQAILDNCDSLAVTQRRLGAAITGKAIIDDIVRRCAPIIDSTRSGYVSDEGIRMAYVLTLYAPVIDSITRAVMTEGL